jgi:hypothetical protein
MNCVFCSSTNNLNTTFQITLDDGVKVTVKICDEHAEDATVKSAKAAYMNREKQISAFLEQAKALGLNISLNNSNNLAVATAPSRQVVSQPVVNEVFTDAVLEGDDVVDTAVLNRSMRSVGGNTEFGMMESHSSLNMSDFTDKLDPNLLRGKAKITMAEGRQGMPIAIPEKRVDGTGTTRVKITQKMNDSKLQDAFKRMADNTMRDSGPDFAHSGYKNSTSTCTFCRGDCVIKNGRETVMCPKCNGSGIISSY